MSDTKHTPGMVLPAHLIWNGHIGVFPCRVCGKTGAQHGSYPTCATHPYTADARCAAVGIVGATGQFIGEPCPGADCAHGCVRRAAIAAATAPEQAK